MADRHLSAIFEVKYMIMLSVDYGDRRTGIAVCDKNQILATPVCVINEWNADSLADKIIALAEEKRAEKIVIGLPKNMDGSKGFRADACEELGDIIKSKCSIPVVFWDERLTTVSAHKILSDNNVRGKKRKAVVDALSAEIILQNYIDSIK
jgi:putative Holliday junction resolvase